MNEKRTYQLEGHQHRHNNGEINPNEMNKSRVHDIEKDHIRPRRGQSNNKQRWLQSS